MENKLIICMPNYREDSWMRKAYTESSMSFEITVTDTNRVAKNLLNKMCMSDSNMVRIMDVDLHWVDPDRVDEEHRAAMGWYIGIPQLKVKVDIMMQRDMPAYFLGGLPRITEIATEIRDFFSSDPHFKGKPLTELRLNYLIKQREREAATEAENALLRANDPGFTKKEALAAIESLKAGATRNNRHKVTMVGRDGTRRVGEEWAVYAKKVPTINGPASSRVDLQLTNWGNRTSVAAVSRVMQEEISYTKTMALWNLTQETTA